MKEAYLFILTTTLLLLSDNVYCEDQNESISCVGNIMGLGKQPARTGAGKSGAVIALPFTDKYVLNALIVFSSGQEIMILITRDGRRLRS